MSLISRSIPGLFGGVSQQIPAMRHPTHAELQENGVATLVDGLQKREAFQHIRNLELAGTSGSSIEDTNGDVFTHVIDRGDEGRFLLTIKDGNMMVHNLVTGVTETINYPNGKAYLDCTSPSADFKAVSVADYTFILNRRTEVATTGLLSNSRFAHRGLVYVKQAVASIDYSIKVDGVSVTYTSTATPNTKDIVAGLIAALTASALVGYTFTEVTPPGADDGPVILIERTSLAATTVGASDGYGNLALLAIHDNVAAYSDLPASLGTTTGVVIKVSPNVNSSKGAYWVRWDPVDFEYVECAAPAIECELDETTLPHKLVYQQETGAFTFAVISDWTQRRAGDDESNPLPSFVGRTINDVFFFRNRLGFLSADSVALSKAGKYFSFFADSAQSVLDTDPIDLANPTEQVVALEWAVPFNEQLIIWADSRQFVLVGGDILSPKTARLVPSTAFEAYMGVRPEPLGNKCIFATTAGDFTAVRMLRVAADTVTNQADDVTEHVPRYIPKDVIRLRASTAAKMLAVLDGTANLYFLNFEEEAVNNSYTQAAYTQKSWSKVAWTDAQGQTSKIIQAHWVDRRLYVVRYVKDSGDALQPGGRFMLELLDFQSFRKDDGAAFSLRLDRKVQPSFTTFDGTDTTLRIPYWERAEMVAVMCNPANAPALLTILSTVFNSDGTMDIKVAGEQSAYPIWVGRRFMFRYRFTEVFMRDSNNAPMQNVKLSVKHILLRYKDTGYFQVIVTPYLRDPYTYDFSGHMLGLIPLEGNQLATGDFKIPVGTNPAGTTIDIESDSYFPATFPYAEWTGRVVVKAQR